MRLQRRWWRFAIAPLAIWLGTATCIPEYVFAEGTPAKVQLPQAKTKEQLVEQGKSSFAKGDFADAVKAFTKAIELDPNDPMLYDARGNAHANLGNSKQARDDYRRSIEIVQSIPTRISAEPSSPLQLAQAQEGDQPASPPAQEPAAQPQQQQQQAEQPGMQDDMPVPQLDIPTPQTDTSAAQQPSFNIVQELASRITASAAAVGSTIDTTQAPVAQTTTGDLLQTAPSVSVRRTSALNLDPRVRGYRSSQINASANGVTQIKTRVDIDSLFSGIDPGIVDNLQVIDGPYTSLYGPGFSFLIADLFPTQRYDSPSLHGSTTLSHGTNGRSIYTRESLWGGGQDWGFYASMGLRTGNDYQVGDNSNEFRVPASYHQWDAYLGLGVDLTPNSRMEVNYIRVEKNNVELPGVVYDLTQSKDEQFNVRYVVQEDREGPEQFVLQYWYTRTPYHGDADAPSKQQTFYQPFITNVFRGFTPPFDVFNLNNTFAQGYSMTSGARSAVTWGEQEGPRLTVGADWRRYEQFYSESHTSPFGTPTIIFGDNFFGIPKSSLDDFGLFTHLTLPIGERLEWTVGGRIDQARAFVGDDYINAGGTAAGNGEPNETLGMAYTTAKFKLNDTYSITSGVGYGMRMPTLAELYSDSPFVPLIRQGNAIIDGNSELTPERNLQFDLGISGQWENMLIGVRAFHANIDNYILYNFVGNAGNPLVDPAFASRTYQYTNLERATLFGGDIFTEARLMPWLSANSTLGYVKGTNHSPQMGGAEGLPGIYPFNTTVGVRVHDPCVERDKWGIELITRMVIGQGYVADSLFEDPTPGYTTLALRGYYKLNENLRLTSSIQNLGDRTYTEHGSLVIVDPDGNRSFVKEPGISWLMGMELEY